MRGTDMISNQIIQTSIDELKAITKVDIYVFDLDGIKVAATTEDIEISREIITGFAASPADSQVVGGYHFLKVLDDSEVAYVLASRSNNDDAYMVGKIAVSQIQNLIIAYKERFDRNNFFQNLILDNLLLVDIYNRAQKLHIEVEGPRIVYRLFLGKYNWCGSAYEVFHVFRWKKRKYLACGIYTITGRNRAYYSGWKICIK